MALQTGLSKRSVPRLTQAMERRGVHPEAWGWETAEGRRWFTRLVVATLSTFSLKRGVGVETLREVFARLRLATQVGCSPGALRHVMQALEATAGETAETWEQAAGAAGEVREMIGGVDETFLERLMVVFQDVPTGYLVLEDVADDRTCATGNALVDARLKALGTEVLSLVSDRAKAWIQLAEQGLECLSMPDVFPRMHDLVKSYALAIGRRLKHAHKQLKAAEQALASHREGLPAAQASQQAQAEGEASRGRGEPVGRETQQVSAAPGDPLADAASMRHRGLGTADVRAGPQPVTHGSGGH